ncbi:hypothetical protein Misp02_55520 [Microtetraspora sp. NBRC 16547]|nr:hypothetical protein Misp02_55520 [Microtetraspora sp. NBRC 16547]
MFATGTGMAAPDARASAPAQPNPSPSESPTGGAPGHMMEGPLGAVHGELVVPKRGGGYQTVTTQTGKVSSINKGFIAVTSTDGFARTYKIDDSTRICAGRKGLSDISTGDTVLVISPSKGNNAPAALIVNLSRPQWSVGHGGGAPAPTPS